MVGRWQHITITSIGKKKTEKEDALPYQIIIYIKPMLNIIGQDFLLISLNKYTFF